MVMDGHDKCKMTEVIVSPLLKEVDFSDAILGCWQLLTFLIITFLITRQCSKSTQGKSSGTVFFVVGISGP